MELSEKLSRCVMIRWLKKPNKTEVAKYVECYWFLEKLPNAEGNAYPKLNPDPSAHLILALPQQHFIYSNDSGVTQVQGSHWLNPYVKTYELDHSKSFACIGIKFHVGAPYSLPKFAVMSDSTTQTLIDNIQAIHVNEMLFSADSEVTDIELLALAHKAPDNCREMLDNICMHWFSDTREDQHSELTRKILPLLANTPINELGNTLFCSQRTLERSFLKVTGLTLKQCQSMKRLESILEFLYQREQSDIDWVEIAFQFGFSDQPHLIRHLKKHIGLTPKDYSLKRGFTIDVYGGVE
jgi:AraC-like DNA-binding protein